MNKDYSKRFIRHCPMCKGTMAIVISQPLTENIRPVLGLCGDCGHVIKWALIRS